MFCPSCGKKSEVSSSRTSNAIVYRRRQCSGCRTSWATKELPVSSPTKVSRENEMVSKDVVDTRRAKKLENKKRLSELLEDRALQKDLLDIFSE